jgi:hypothetical protein
MTENWQTQYYSTSRDYDVVDRDQRDVDAIVAVFNADYTYTPITPSDADDLVWSPTNALIAAAERGVKVEIIMTNDDNEYATPFNALVAVGAGAPLPARLLGDPDIDVAAILERLGVEISAEDPVPDSAGQRATAGPQWPA